MKRFFIILSLLVSSCASVNTSKFELSNYSVTPKSIIKIDGFFNLFPNNVKMAQYVSYKHSDSERSAQVVFNKSDVISISVLSLIGIEVLAAYIKGEELVITRSFKGIEPEFLTRVIADMTLVYSDKEDLKKVISPSLSIIDSDQQRIIMENSKEVLRINYESARDWKSNFQYEHFLSNFKLEVKTTSYKQ